MLNSKSTKQFFIALQETEFHVSTIILEVTRFWSSSHQTRECEETVQVRCCSSKELTGHVSEIMLTLHFFLL
jgi:hypothetical protein